MPKKNKKNLYVGIGVSKNKDAYKAAKEAAEKSIKGFNKEQNFSIVYTNADYDQNEIARGVNEVLGKNWVGASADKQFNSEFSYSKDIVVSVLSIQSDYMHFGIGVAKNYRKNPVKSAKKATEQAIKSIKSDKYIDSYIQFTRTKKQEYNKIVKTPPYFILTFVSGAEFQNKKSIPGKEIEFLRGILEYLGPHIPVFGGGAGSDFETYLYENEGKNYQFANGEALSNAGVVVFVICNLFFLTNVRHGYLTTDKFAAITKLDKSGYEILEINGHEPVAEYCKLVGIKKQDYLKDPFKYSLKNPFGLITLEGNTYVKEALPNPDNKTFHSTLKLSKNYVMNILRYDEKSHFKTMLDILKEASKNEGRMALTLFCNCSTRRLLMKDNVIDKIRRDIKSKFKTLLFFGFYAFSEIGSTAISSAQVHGETVTSLVIFDKLLVE
jgi:hypothetical protein